MPRFPNNLDLPTVAADVASTVEIATIGTVIRQTTLKLTNTPVTVVGATGVGFGGTKVLDMPAGRILILGATASMAFPILSTEGDLADTADGDWAMGTTSEEDGSMDRATDINIIPKTATSANALSTATVGSLADCTSAQHIDGTSTAMDLYINATIDDAETNETSVLGATGTVTITWINLGGVA